MPMFSRVPLLASGVKTEELLKDLLEVSLSVEDAARLAHWNIRGPEFVALHGLFGEVYDTASKASDTIAERLVALGFVAPGIASMECESFAKAPPAGDTPNGTKLSDSLVTRLQTFSRMLLKVFEALTTDRDHGTANLLIGIQNDIDKLIWKVQKFNP